MEDLYIRETPEKSIIHKAKKQGNVQVPMRFITTLAFAITALIELSSLGLNCIGTI